MMLTAVQTNPGSSVFALHSNSASNSAQQDRPNQTHVNGIAQCAMNKSSSTPPPSSSSSSPATNHYQGLTPQFIPMAPIPQPQVLIGPGGSYTILPSLTSLGGAADATSAFGNIASLHPIAGGFSPSPSTHTIGVSSTSSTPITAVQATYYPGSHHTPSARERGGVSTSGREGERVMYRNCSSPGARQFAPPISTTAASTSSSSTSAVILGRPGALSNEHSRNQSRLMQNGNQTSIVDSHSPPSDTKPNMNSLLLQQQLQANPPLRISRIVSPPEGSAPLTSSSSDPSLHHSGSSTGSASERLLDPSPSAVKFNDAVLPRRGSRNNAMEIGQGGGAVLPIEIKREPEEGSPVIQSCSRRHSESSTSGGGGVADSSNLTNVSLSSSSTATGSKNSPYPVSALIDVPIITPLNRSSRTSSLSSSLSSFRFGGSLSQLWASQISLSGNLPKVSNMKSTGNLHAEAAAMPSLGNQYFAFGGSLPELSLTSLTRLLPNSSANDPNISSCPSLFTLFHPPLYVYPSQQHLTTPFINPNGSISFGSFLSSGTSLCSMQKNSTGTSGTTGTTSSSSNSVRGASTTTTVSSTASIITGKANKVDDSPGAYGRSPLPPQPATNQNDPPVRLSAMYSSLPIGGAQVITALPGFSTITAARGFPDPVVAAAAAAGVVQSHSGSITSHTDSITSHAISASTHSNLAPLYSSTVAPTTTISHSATAPNCDLNTLACVATAQMQQQRQKQSPHHLPIPHPSPDAHLHHTAVTTPTPQGGGALGSGNSATPPGSHDSKEGILAAMHGGGGATPIEVYGLGGGNPSPLLPGGVAMSQLDMKGEHAGRMTRSPVDMSGGLGGQLLPMEISQSHMQQQGAMSPGGGGGEEMKVKKERDKPYKCDHPGCGRSFSFPAHLRSHIQQIHISYRPCKCEFPGCGKRFYTPQHLNVHRRVHTGERPFICPYADCGKAFTTAGNLKNHIRTHTGERPYACKYDGCLKRFAEMSSLKKHELTHTGEKPYKCRVCGKAFSQAGSRNTHERKHNPVSEEGGELTAEGSSGRRYRIKRVPVVANGNATGMTSPVGMVEEHPMQH